jgi:hypothetical protein
MDVPRFAHNLAVLWRWMRQRPVEGGEADTPAPRWQALGRNRA